MAGLLVILTSLIIGVYLTRRLCNDARHKDILRILYVAMGISATGVLSQLFYLPYSHVIYQVCCLTGTSLLLVSMLIFIRKLKHEIFRYPLFMAYSPLILPLTYLLIYDVAILRDILFAGIGILPVLVAVILIDSYKKKEAVRRYSIGIALLISLVLINRNLSLFPFQMPNLELILIGVGGLALYYLFLLTFKDFHINTNPINIE